jgi:hypothetical protein
LWLFTLTPLTLRFRLSRFLLAGLSFGLGMVAMNSAKSTSKSAPATVVDFRSAWYADHDRKHTELKPLLIAVGDNEVSNGSVTDFETSRQLMFYGEVNGLPMRVIFEIQPG